MRPSVAVTVPADTRLLLLTQLALAACRGGLPICKGPITGPTATHCLTKRGAGWGSLGSVLTGRSATVCRGCATPGGPSGDGEGDMSGAMRWACQLTVCRIKGWVSW